MCRFPCRLVLLASLITLLVGVARAAPGGDDGWYVLGSWRTVANGDDVRAMARDGDELWAATTGGGVVRWSADGGAWRQYLAPQDGLGCNDVRDVVSWRNAWWFATCDGLLVYDARRDRMEAVVADLPSPAVTALAVDDQDRLWVATSQWWDARATFPGQEWSGGWVGGGVAYSADGSHWENLGAAGGLPSTDVRDIVAWRGYVWVATVPYFSWRPPSRSSGGDPVPGRWDMLGGGVARYDGRRWDVFDSTTQDELSDNARVLAGDDRALWVGTGGRGLVVFDGSKWQALMDCGRAERCIQDNFVTALAVVPDGPVWVATTRFNGRGTGIDLLDARGTPTDPEDDAWHVVGVADGLPGERVHAILPDTDGTVWFGTSSLDPDGEIRGTGLARLKSDRATLAVRETVGIGDGAPAGNAITVVALHPLSGDLWVGTAKSGLSVRDRAGRWRRYTRSSTGGGLRSDQIADIAIEPSGVVWVATRQATFDADGGEWLDGGLSRFDGTSWLTLAGPESGLPSNHLSALALDGRGKLWVGSGATDSGSKEHAYRGWGLAVVDTATARWERTFTFPTLASNNITDIAVTDREVWVASAYFFYVDPRPGGAQLSIGGGLSVYDLASGRWRNLTDSDGLSVAVRGRGAGLGSALLDLRSVFVDSRGTAWVGGLSYPEATYTADRPPDGVVDVIDANGVATHRFPGAGPIVALQPDPSGHLWAASAQDGARVRVDGQWLHLTAQKGGLPTARLTAMSFAGGQVWFGTAGGGLVELVPPGAVPADPRVIIRRLPIRLYVPSVVRYTGPTIEPGPMER